MRVHARNRTRQQLDARRLRASKESRPTAIGVSGRESLEGSRHTFRLVTTHASTARFLESDASRTCAPASSCIAHCFRNLGAFIDVCCVRTHRLCLGARLQPFRVFKLRADGIARLASCALQPALELETFVRVYHHRRCAGARCFDETCRPSHTSRYTPAQRTTRPLHGTAPHRPRPCPLLTQTPLEICGSLSALMCPSTPCSLCLRISRYPHNVPHHSTSRRRRCAAPNTKDPAVHEDCFG